MPRIDPLALLRCLAVLLSPEGGILSRDEVPRLVNLMTKFSKKLVSKCVYINILKSTDVNLVDLFMAEGGWTLIQTWLQDATQIANWDLVKEILTLLLTTPVDVERLKLNNIPKLVKGLSRLEDDKGVQELSQQLVQNWLQIVKNSTRAEEIKIEVQSVQEESASQSEPTSGEQSEETSTTVDEEDGSNQVKEEIKQEEMKEIPPSSFYKLTIKDGKQVISRTVNEEVTEKINVDEKQEEKKEKNEDKDKRNDRSKSRSKSSSNSKSSSSRSHKSSSTSSSKDRDRDRDKDRHRSSSKSSSSNRDKDRKDRDRDKNKDKDKNKNNGEKSKDNKETKEKQAEKDKDTLAKIKPQAVDKLGRIPKKSESNDKSKDEKTKEVKKPTMSVETRKNNEERPKTVKVFNSKRRSTGLEEEAKPAPPRTAVKKPTTTTPPQPLPPLKRPSPTRDASTAPIEKKLKIDVAPPERPGSIKLIPPKPKPPVLQESDIFMDALAASAAPKKENKKRKRRPSTSKEPESPAEKEPQTPSSPLGLKTLGAGLNFYQDSLQNDENNENEENTPQNNESKVEISEPENKDITEKVDDLPEEIEVKAVTKNENGLKGALVYVKRKGPKKSVRFNDIDLTQVRFFELDETERVNVTRTFMDMAKMDISSEREALQLSRKLTNEDLMEPQTYWRTPLLIDQSEPLVAPGSKSLEKDIQFAREKSVLQALYFDKRKIPDSPEEPISENHQMSDPKIIPLEDADSQDYDLRATPWPEPKGSPPHKIEEPNIPPQIFNNIQIPFQNFPNIPPPFQNMPPRFVGPNQFPPNILPNGIAPNMVPPHPEMMHQGPPMFGGGPGGPGPDFNPMINDNFGSMPQFNPPPNMVGPMFNNNFNNRGRGGFRRGNNNGPWIPMNRGGGWNRGGGGGRGGGMGSGRLCKNIKNHGFCRNLDKCPFVHPNK